METQTPRTLDAKHWLHLLKRNGSASLIACLFVWGIFGAACLGLNMRSRYSRAIDAVARTERDLDRERARGREATFGIAVVVTCWAVARFVRRTWRAVYLFRHGVQCAGTIRRFGGIVDWPTFRKTTFSYMHEGRPYQSSVWGENAWDVWGPDAVAIGHVVPVVLDPRKPTRAMMAKDVFPLEAEASAENEGDKDSSELG